MERPLAAGEVFYSVVRESDEDLIRVDISAEAWQGPPEDALGWWKGKMPDAGPGRMKLAPTHVLVELVKQMVDEPSRVPVRYLMSLMLMRKRALRPIANEEESNGTLLLEVSADGSRIEVTECDVPAEDRDRIREELTELLYCEVDEP